MPVIGTKKQNKVKTQKTKNTITLKNVKTWNNIKKRIKHKNIKNTKCINIKNIITQKKAKQIALAFST